MQTLAQNLTPVLAETDALCASVKAVQEALRFGARRDVLAKIFEVLALQIKGGAV